MGENDHDLAMRLATAGSDHGKYLRQIEVSMDIEAAWMWWKQYATYKVGTVENSTSMMHTLFKKDLAASNFCWTKVTPFREKFLEHVTDLVEDIKKLDEKIKEITKGLKNSADDWQDRKEMKILQKKRYEKWRELNEDMSGSYSYKRTCALNYEVLRNMYHVRKTHKLVEWHIFANVIEDLPYSELIITPRK
jgi:hypothetical protein